MEVYKAVRYVTHHNSRGFLGKADLKDSEGQRDNKVLHENYSHEEHETEGRFLINENFVFLSPQATMPYNKQGWISVNKTKTKYVCRRTFVV